MKSVRVLLVHDQSLVRQGLSLLLESSGEIAVAAAAGDGREAVRLVRKHKPDIIVIGVAMPELQGLLVARQLRDAFPHLNIVMLLMLSVPDHLCQLLAGQALGCIARPGSATDLIEAVQAAFEGRPHPSIIPCPAASQHGFSPHASNRANPLHVLSGREREVLRLVVSGRASKEIAGRLRIATSTVDTYRGRIMNKFGLDSLAALIKFALEHGVAPCQ